MENNKPASCGSLSQEFRYKARQIKLMAFDVDGVLTDGRVCYSSQGEELKSFHIQDGLGIKLLQSQGIEVAIITGRVSTMVTKRSQELGIKTIIQGREDKLIALKELLVQQKNNITLENVAYMGDDLPDLSAMLAVTLSFAPLDAHLEIINVADYKTISCGGKGAVREACDIILKARKQYQQAIAAFYGD